MEKQTKPKPKTQTSNTLNRSTSSNSNKSELSRSEPTPYSTPTYTPQPPYTWANKATQFPPLPSPPLPHPPPRPLQPHPWPEKQRKNAAEGGRGWEVVEFGVRVIEIISCLISFAVLAADSTPGWSGDSFERYIEYRFCLSVNVIGFVYSGFQAYDVAYHLITGRRMIRSRLFSFFVDQVVAYLLMSASSSAATRVDDWQSNWGKDEFTKKASASIAMSFVSFAAFAISSVVSGYKQCNPQST